MNCENPFEMRVALSGMGQSVPTPVDDTLSIAGMAADAKATGDALAQKASQDEMDGLAELIATKADETSLEDLEARVADLEYKPMAISAFGTTPNQAEQGSTVSTVALAYTMNKVPASASLDGIAQEITEPTGTIQQTGAITANRTWTLVAQDERGAVASKAATLSFLWKAYFGAAAAPGAINSAFLLSLANGVLTASRARTFTVNAGAGQYIWYAVPSSFGACTFKVGGFDGGFSKVSTFQHTNASGGVTNYDVYRSDNAELGNTTVVVS